MLAALDTGDTRRLPTAVLRRGLALAELHLNWIDEVLRSSTMRDSPEQVLRRYYRHVWVEGRISALDELLAPNYRDHDPPPGYTSDRAGARKLAAALVSNMRETSELRGLGLIHRGKE
jgi:SnoaL-like domain